MFRRFGNRKEDVMVNKLRAGARQLAESGTMETTAIRDLAASALSDLVEDNIMLGNALVLLAGRNCSPRCPVSARSHRMRHREFGLLD